VVVADDFVGVTAIVRDVDCVFVAAAVDCVCVVVAAVVYDEHIVSDADIVVAPCGRVVRRDAFTAVVHSVGG
jgi:hypothetical protein